MISRVISLNVHAAIEVIAAPLLFVAPFYFGFPYAAAAVSMTLGVLLVGHALSLYGEGERRAMPLSAHAGFDYLIALATLAAGLVVAIAGETTAGIFMAGFGTGHIALTASTRFSQPLGA
jgi:hypothetical protein